MVVADTLSRGNFSKKVTENLELTQEISVYATEVLGNIKILEKQLNGVYEAQQKDTILSKAISFTLQGWLNEFSDKFKPFFATRGELSVSNMILVYRNRIVISTPMRNKILDRIHEGHFSLEKCRKRACESLWWPNISVDISNFIENCSFCQVYKEKIGINP